MSEKRFRFVKDDDGHDYLIPAELEKEFELWLIAVEDWDDTWNGPDFDQYRTSMSPNNYTFTDPKEDK